MKVSILLLTFNEAANLPRCLDAVAWCDDVLVVDSGSTDDTVEIARSYGARVLSRPFDTFAGQRNFGLTEGGLAHKWVLHLDADEVVTPQFVSTLSALSPAAGIDAYNVPSKLMLFDRWLKHAGMYPSYQVRLGHRDRLRFKQVGHGQREDLPAERIAVFPEPYLHFNFSHGMAAWLAKHSRYARDEADLVVAMKADAISAQERATLSGSTGRRRYLKSLVGRMPWVLRPVLRFVYVYVLRQGFRDGRAGLAYALMMSVYEGMIAIYGYEHLLRQRATAAAVNDRGASPKAE